MMPGPPGRAADGWREGVLVPERGEPTVGARRTLVVKFGGSLLSRAGWPDLAGRLVAAHAARGGCLVVGGGAVVEGLREIDRASAGSRDRMHRLAIEAMGLTGRLVAETLGLPVASEPGDGLTVLDVDAWLARDGRGLSLPSGWQVTSDSIAARVADVHRAGLLLFKSRPPPPCPESGDPLAGLAAAGWVDEYFPEAAGGLGEIRWAAPSDSRTS
ncbi:MAG: hypothetical protein ACKOTB_17715 [Planctomycetia bacterium]